MPQTGRWAAVKARIAASTACATRCSIAIAPTATIASIAGCYECIEPQVSNLFKRETMSGEFLQINTYLVRELKARGLWTSPRSASRSNGPRDRCRVSRRCRPMIRELFRTAWELPQKSAHRPGRGPGAVHRPVAVAEPVPERARPSARSPRCTCTPGRPA